MSMQQIICAESCPDHVESQVNWREHISWHLAYAMITRRLMPAGHI